jgi:hypothetical protein
MEELGVGTTPLAFVKLFISALFRECTLTRQSDGALSLHLQYMPKTHLDVEGEFVLQQSATAVPPAVASFIMQLAQVRPLIDWLIEELVLLHARVRV